MKKYIAIAALSLLSISCSDDDNKNQNQEQTQKDFFNLKEGNMWVYKRVIVNAEGDLLQTTVTDTVRIIGSHIIDSRKYFKEEHKEYQNGYLSGRYLKYLRVNNEGHLVNETGKVIHPGRDSMFTDEVIFEHGTLNYKSDPSKNISLEGKEFYVIPYVGYFTPSAEGIMGGIGNSLEYQEGIGLILSKARYIASLTYVEDRLVSYDLK